MQRALHAATSEPTWEVFNEGWPGRNSRELLQLLGAQIERLQPLLRWARDDDPWAARVHRVAHHIAVATEGDPSASAEWLRAHGSALELQPGDDPRQGGGAGTVRAVLRGHLRRIVALCREREVQPVLIAYPHDWDFLEVHREVAVELEVPLVATWPALQAARQATPGLELYVPDGHCNDAGCGLRAGEVAKALTTGR